MRVRGHILIVEDDVAVCEGLALALAAHGFIVATASDADEALKRAAAEAPDVVICDWQLGHDVLDGVDVAQRIAVAADSDLKPDIIMVTARDLLELKSRAAGLPIKAFLRKPVRLSSILELLA